MITLNNKKKWAKSVAVILFLAFCEWFFFRNVIGTENGALISNRGDGRLCTLLAEHWWNFFRGKEGFFEISMYYPVEFVLGYSDLLLGYGLIHSFLRFIGINMFTAYKWTLISIHCMGTATMYYLLKKKLNIRISWALFGTLAFSFSDTYARHLGHTQLGAISALPLLLVLLIGFIRNFENRKKRNIYAYAFITWFVLITYTSWYIAYFTGLFSLVFLIIYFIVLKSGGVALFPMIKNKILFLGKDILCYLTFMIILYIPFIYVYLPALTGSGGYSYDLHTLYMPEFIDIINVSESNWMLGHFIEKLRLLERGYSLEVTEGFSVVLLCFFISLWIVHVKKRNGNSSTNDHSKKIAQSLIDATCIAIVMCIVLTIRLGSNGVSLWWIVFHVIPLAKSVRAVARFLLWLSFPMAVITAYTADKYVNLKHGGARIIVSTGAVVLIFLSNVNTIGVSQQWDLSSELDILNNIPIPPENAKVLYIIDTERKGEPYYIYQLDAFEIATLYSLKTINGYSGRFPSGWGKINNVCSDTYEDDVANWIYDNGIETASVYAYDRATNSWSSFEERTVQSRKTIDTIFSPSDARFSVTEGLMDHSQGAFAWCGRNFSVKLHNADIKDTGLKINLHTPLEYYLLQDPLIEPYVLLYVDGKYVQDIPVIDEYMEYTIPMTNHENDEYYIELKTNGYFVPLEIGQNEDSRHLSIAIYYIGN